MTDDLLRKEGYKRTLQRVDLFIKRAYKRVGFMNGFVV